MTPIDGRCRVKKEDTKDERLNNAQSEQCSWCRLIDDRSRLQAVAAGQREVVSGNGLRVDGGKWQWVSATELGRHCTALKPRWFGPLAVQVAADT
jgi:hypothetical protein